MITHFARPCLGRHAERGRTERAELDALLDEVLAGTLSTVVDGRPWVVPMLFARDGDGWRHDPERGEHRRLVCRTGNPFALPAKDRSGRLDVTEPPDLGALLARINATSKG